VTQLILEVSVECESWGDPADMEALAARAMDALHAELPEAAGEASLTLGDDAMIQTLNGQWRGFDKPTNVLSFPSTGPQRNAGFLGDILIAHQTVMAEAERDGVSPGDHLTHLMIHGCLHLLGYDHETDTDAEAMEAIETRVLARIGISDPYTRAAEAA
jgi:probable rRNA maturation factor